MGMNETIEQLLEVQELDVRILELVTERDKRPEALRREQAEVAAGTALVDAAVVKQKEAQVAVDRLNKIIMGREEEIKKLEIQMLAPKISNKEYKTLQTSIASIRADNDLTETEIFEAMEEVDRLADDVESKRRDLAGHEAALAEAKRRVETEVGLFNEQIDELRAERDEKTSAMSMEITQLYEKVCQARGSSAVAAVTEGHCEGCYMTVTMQDATLILRGDRLHQCKTCQRILYIRNPADYIGAS
jgi:uncharacterized protein